MVQSKVHPQFSAAKGKRSRAGGQEWRKERNENNIMGRTVVRTWSARWCGTTLLGGRWGDDDDDQW